MTLLDTRVEGLRIEMEGGGCEDSLNLMRVSGDVDSIQISNAAQDGLDLDFSDLSIASLDIDVSGNDCLDLSSGDYIIANAALRSCDDKALSVGEKANVEISVLSVESSSLGLAVKDSSDVVIRDGTMSIVDLCAAVYRKKQEFGGAKLTLPRTFCPGSDPLVQQGSRLDYLNASAN
jgi:hypothetical protein